MKRQKSKNPSLEYNKNWQLSLKQKLQRLYNVIKKESHLKKYALHIVYTDGHTKIEINNDRNLR